MDAKPVESVKRKAKKQKAEKKKIKNKPWNMEHGTRNMEQGTIENKIK